jgi:hypothetical protein
VLEKSAISCDFWLIYSIVLEGIISPVKDVEITNILPSKNMEKIH